MRIESSVVIVTGGGPGIGRALAEEFAAAGTRVVAGDVDRPGGDETPERIRERADAASTAVISALIALVENEFGSVDIDQR
jgi:NAD(P)-dependent dehydrogenase (short-subunit alcohol dehydrogenase family)